VAWCDLTKDDFSEEYWCGLWDWYESGGYGHVAAYLAELNLSPFNPKAPPKKTEAFWAIVNTSRAPEEGELADIIDRLGDPEVVTLSRLQGQADGDFALWLGDRRNRRALPHRLESCGYVPVRNPYAKDGHWRVGGVRQAVYAKATLTLRDQIGAVERLCQ
jgi:hypothetical protein